MTTPHSDQELLGKIKTLNENLWDDQASGPKVQEWLSNFDGQLFTQEKERRIALYMLSQFIYFGDRQLRELIGFCYQDGLRRQKMREIRKANSDTRDEDFLERKYKEILKGTRFVPIGNPSESSAHLLYYYRQENGLHKKLFVQPHKLLEDNSQSDGVPIADIIFIDDFCGSGSQATAYVNALSREIRRKYPNVKLQYHVLFAYNLGLEYVRNSGVFDSAYAVYNLDETFRVFSSNSRFWPSDTSGEINAKEGMELAERYCEHLVSNDPAYMNKWKFGWSDCALMLGFRHNTPDNTLPIFWYAPTNGFWKPIFRRYPKVGDML